MTNYEILKERDTLAAMEERLHKNCCWCVNYERCGEPEIKPSRERCKAMWRSFFDGADTPKKLADRMSRAHDCDECPVVGKCPVHGMCGELMEWECGNTILAWLKSENVLYDIAIGQSRTDLVVEAIDNIEWYHQNDNGDMVSGASNEHEAWYKADDIYKALESVPSAQPEQRWIPCSERLPKENGHYLVTFHQTATEEDLGFDMDDTDVRKMRYDTKHGWRTPRRIPSWINDAVVSTVLAWMPLPEAWKGEHDG